MTATGSEARETVAHFDRISAEYAALYDLDTPVGYSFSVRRQRVLDLFDAPGGRVLDVGCGPGILASAMTARGCSFFGVDPAESMIREARRTNCSPSSNFWVGGAEALPVRDRSFDAVTCMGVLERIADDEQALTEMVRVLTTGGTLILTVPNQVSPALVWRDHVFYRVVGWLRPLYLRITHAEAHEVIRGHRRYRRGELSARLERLGCDTVEVDYCSYPVLWAPLDAAFPRVSRWLMQRAEAFRSTPLRVLGGAIVLKAKKRG